jgi:hypothetical protein
MQAYRILARNLKTRQRIERNTLSGLPVTDESEAWRLAHALAEQQEKVTGEQWAAEVDIYETRS